MYKNAWRHLNLLTFCRLRCSNSLISLMLKTEKRANKVAINTKYCYSPLKGMWVDCLCQRSPVEIQRYITNSNKEILLPRPPPKGDVTRLLLPEITSWNTKIHYKLKKRNIATPALRGCELIASARDHQLKYKDILHIKSWNTEYLSVCGCW